MRVLHITSGLGAGGAERSLLQLANAASESAAGHVMQVASLTAASALASQLHQPALICDLRAEKLAALNSLLAHTRSFRPDVIQGWMYHGNLVASYVGWKTGVPVIWSIRHSLEQPEKETKVLRWVIGLGRLGCFQPRRVVYNSYSGWRTHAQSGYGRKPSMIIPNGVDIKKFSTTTKSGSDSGSVAAPGAVPVVGCVARFHPMKGLATLLAAHAAMQADQPCELMLVGEGMDAENAELAELIARVGCGEKVTPLGLVANMPELYPQFSAVVLPSLYGEGTPNVLLEAMASGVPVVASRVGDAARCVGKDEWLVAPGDVAQLGATLQRLLALSAEERAALVTDNRRHVSDNFSLARCHDSYMALYRELHETYPVTQVTGAAS